MNVFIRKYWKRNLPIFNVFLLESFPSREKINTVSLLFFLIFFFHKINGSDLYFMGIFIPIRQTEVLFGSKKNVTVHVGKINSFRLKFFFPLKQ